MQLTVHRERSPTEVTSTASFNNRVARSRDVRDGWPISVQVSRVHRLTALILMCIGIETIWDGYGALSSVHPPRRCSKSRRKAS